MIHVRDDVFVRVLLEYRVRELERKLDHVRAAAMAVIERWETPLWKDAGPTGDVIYALRRAIE